MTHDPGEVAWVGGAWEEVVEGVPAMIKQVRSFPASVRVSDGHIWRSMTCSVCFFELLTVAIQLRQYLQGAMVTEGSHARINTLPCALNTR